MVDQIKEYLKLHILSLNQDMEHKPDYAISTKINIQGQIMASEHILSYIDELDNALYERV